MIIFRSFGSFFSSVRLLLRQVGWRHLCSHLKISPEMFNERGQSPGLAFTPKSFIFVSSGWRILFLMVWKSFKWLLANSRHSVMCLLLGNDFHFVVLKETCCRTILSLWSTETSFDCLLFDLWPNVNCGILHRLCVFPNQVQSAEFSTDGLHLFYKNILRRISGNEGCEHLCKYDFLVWSF